MGGNASRFEVINGATLLKRLDAIKGRRRSLKKLPTTISKKQLLPHPEEMKISVSSRPSSDGTLPYNSLEDIITNTPKATPDPTQEIKIETKGSVGIAIIIAANNCGVKVISEDKPIVINDANKENPRNAKKVTFSDKDEDEDEDEDEEEDDGRRIGYEDDEAFPGSPSFRVYFEENRECSHNKSVKSEDAFTQRDSTGNVVPPKKVTSNVEKKVKRERKKRYFRKVLPKRGSQADLKRLLNMKSCYS